LGVKSGVQADFEGVMVTVHGASFGGQDGLDMARRVDAIVAAFDRRSGRNLTDFYSNGYMLAAHTPESLQAAAGGTMTESNLVQRERRRS
jgi:hypothetical protein